MFGGMNALFSAFAFAGVIYTILLQRDELHLQRIELRDTRRELARAAESQALKEALRLRYSNASATNSRLCECGAHRID